MHDFLFIYNLYQQVNDSLQLNQHQLPLKTALADQLLPLLFCHLEISSPEACLRNTPTRTQGMTFYHIKTCIRIRTRDNPIRTGQVLDPRLRSKIALQFPGEL